MRHRPPLVLNVPHNSGSRPRKLSMYYTNSAVKLEILCISDISGAELVQFLEPSWLPTTRKECATGFKYTSWNEAGEAMNVSQA